MGQRTNIKAPQGRRSNLGPGNSIKRKDGSYWNANGHPGVEENWTNSVPVIDMVTGNIFIFYALNDPDTQEAFRGYPGLL